MTVLDGSQAIVHLEINVEDIDVIYTFTGHAFGPTGTGVLYVNKKNK